MSALMLVAAPILMGTLLGGGSFLLGYHIGRKHERQGWVLWLDHKIPRMKGQRP